MFFEKLGLRHLPISKTSNNKISHIPEELNITLSDGCVKYDNVRTTRRLTFTSFTRKPTTALRHSSKSTQRHPNNSWRDFPAYDK